MSDPIGSAAAENPARKSRRGRWKEAHSLERPACALLLPTRPVPRHTCRDADQREADYRPRVSVTNFLAFLGIFWPRKKLVAMVSGCCVT